MRTRRVLLIVVPLALVALALVAPYAVGHGGAVTFNQTLIEADLASAGALTGADRWRAARSRYGAGLNRLLAAAGPPGDKVRMDEPESVLRFLFERFPDPAIVYPTETYYYYRFRLRDRVISGNVRLLDAHKGLLHIGYFDANDRGAMRSATFGAEDGVEIEPAGEGRFDVTYEGRTVRFILPRRFLERPDSLELLEHESFVTGVLDESGVALCLLYNTVLEGFFYVVNPDVPLSEERIPVEGGGGRFFVGERTRFVYYDDPDHERTLLVGVDAEHISANDYYDGPFDQVPPRLSIGDRLRAAYPYTEHRGGIDDHGNFIELEGQRVAISAYQAYRSLHRLVDRMRGIEEDALVAAERWNRMTYERKRTFDPDKAERTLADAPIWHQQGWPSNHWGHNSRAWPGDHERSGSLGWPANHDPAMSSERAQASE